MHSGTGDGLPMGTTNTISLLFGAAATCENPPGPCTPNGAPSPYTPFGFWFANPTTIYVADEGYPNTDVNGNLIPDPLAGLEKWSLVDGTWRLLYTLRAGLDLYQAETVGGYRVPTSTYGLRNMTGEVNEDGTVTIYAITSQFSLVSNGEPDPTKLVTVTDSLAATTLPGNEQFKTLQTSNAGEVFRGVAFSPCGPNGERGLGGTRDQAVKRTVKGALS